MSDVAAVLREAKTEYEALGLLSFHGHNGCWYADLAAEDIQRIAALIRQLAKVAEDERNGYEELIQINAEERGHVVARTELLGACIVERDRLAARVLELEAVPEDSP